LIEPLDLFALSYPLIILAVSVSGKTVDEIGRLWIPLMVPLLVIVARGLARMRTRCPCPYAVSAFVMILLIKNFNDFQ